MLTIKKNRDRIVDWKSRRNGNIDVRSRVVFEGHHKWAGGIFPSDIDNHSIYPDHHHHWKQASLGIFECDFIEKIEKPKNIFLTINGWEFSVPEKLKKIIASIEDAEYLLHLQEDWDESGANSTNEYTFKKALDFIVSYSRFIWNKYKVAVTAPYIDILRDGSITASWETEFAHLLIVFKKDHNEYSYLYGEEKNAHNIIPFSRAVKNGDEIDETTAVWMSQKMI